MSKKLIAGAGVVASFAIALAPLATFADEPAPTASDTHTDKLVINVPAACTFGDFTQNTSPLPGGITHDAVSGTAYGTTTESGTGAYVVDSNGVGLGSNGDANLRGQADANASKHTITRTVLAGTTAPAFANTTMKVVCNNANGYYVKVATPNLTDGDGHTIDAKNGNAPAETDGSRTAAYSASVSGYDLDSITAANGTSGGSDVVSASTFYANATANSAETIVRHTGVSARTGDTITVTYGIGVQSDQTAGTYYGEVVYSLFQGVEQPAS